MNYSINFIKKYKYLFITIITVSVSIIFQLIFIRYASYSIDKEIYGNFILLQILISGLSYAFLQIPARAFDRFYNEAKDKTDYINEFRSILIMVNIVSIFIIIIYGYIVKKFSINILILEFFFFLLLNSFSFNQTIFLLNMERRKYFYLKTLEAMSKFLMPIIFYFYFHSLESLLLGIILGYSISFFILIKFLKKYPFKLNINLENYKKYFSFAYPIFLVSIFIFAITFTDRYFIEYFMQTKDVGIYAILAQVAGMGQIIGQIYSMHVNPKVLHLYEKNKKDGLDYLSSTIKNLFKLFLALSIIIYFIPIDIYTILLEKSLISQPYYYWTFIILTISTFLIVLQIALNMYFSLAKKYNILVYLSGVAFLVNMVGNFYIAEYGIIAAAISTLLAYLTLCIGQIIFITRGLHE